jgi:hypothetical protein
MATKAVHHQTTELPAALQQERRHAVSRSEVVAGAIPGGTRDAIGGRGLTGASARLLPRALQLREAVLLCFCDPLPAETERLLSLSANDWQRLLLWMDTSGLALYFLDRLADLDLLGVLPPAVVARLRQNMADNSERIAAMIAESEAIQRRFQQTGVEYAVLKGFSLWPVSVPKLELRSQLDLDFLVSERSVDQARTILEDFGYRLTASTGRDLDFHANEGRPPSMKTMYQPGFTRTAELHVERLPPGCTSLLKRTDTLRIRDVNIPVLPAVDLFLGQGLHAYKHVCSQFSRASHLIEFRRHILARYHDQAFWAQLEERVSQDSRSAIRLGTVILLITRVMGPFAPEALTRWTVDRLPAAAKLWVELYGRRLALTGFPGSKLYLLLESELETCGLPAKKPLLQALVPRRLPPAIAQPVQGETASARMARYRRQLSYMLLRLRFSAVEGTRFVFESIRWRRYKNGVSQ